MRVRDSNRELPGEEGVQRGEAAAGLERGAGKAAPGPALLDAEELAKRAAAARHVSSVFGDAVAMLARSQHFKHYALADLEWLRAPDRASSEPFANVERVNQSPKKSPPPLALGQCFIATGQDKSTGFAAPIGFLLWASVSDEVDRRLTENVGQPIRLRPDEWKSGETVWLVAAEGDPRVVAGMIARVREGRLGGRVPKAVVVGEGGNRVVVECSAIPKSMEGLP